MLIFLVLLLVLLFAGLGFAIHFFWVLAVVFLVFWLAGVGLGRGESAGNRTVLQVVDPSSPPLSASSSTRCQSSASVRRKANGLTYLLWLVRE